MSEKLDWRNITVLCVNIEFLKENYDKIDWDYLPLNKNAKEMVLENINKIDWVKTYDLINQCLPFHELKITLRNLIKENVEIAQIIITKYYLKELGKPYNVLIEIEKKYNISLFIENIIKSKHFVDFEEWFISELNWDYVSSNENAVELLKKYPEKIMWNSLLSNKNPIVYEWLKLKIEHDKGELGLFNAIKKM